MKAIIFVLVVVGLINVQGVIYDRCGIAKVLLANGFPRNQLENWVCLVESESSGNTGVRGGPNSDGSYDYGLFQINDRYWCKPGYPGGECNIDCNRLLDDNISDDTKCVWKIYKVHGFSAWNGWKNKCQGALPNLKPCGF